MAPTGKMTNIAPGNGGIQRDPKTLASHHLPGGRELVGRALTLKAKTRVVPQGRQVEVEIVAQHVGHRVPTGFVDRHLILVVQAVNAKGQSVELLDGPDCRRAPGNGRVSRECCTPSNLSAMAAERRRRSGRTSRRRWTRGSCPTSRTADVCVRRLGRTVNVKVCYRRFWQAVADQNGWKDNDMLDCRTDNFLAGRDVYGAKSVIFSCEAGVPGKMKAMTSRDRAMIRITTTAGLLILAVAAAAEAGLYYSGEQYASLPAQWRGFLLDHRLLRNIAVKPKVEAEASPLRTRYRLAAEKPQACGRQGQAERRTSSPTSGRSTFGSARSSACRRSAAAGARRASESLRHRRQSRHGLAAHGDFVRPQPALEDAVRLAPGKVAAARGSASQARPWPIAMPSRATSTIFSASVYRMTRAATSRASWRRPQMKKLPAKAVAIAQQLALWLPADGPLLWQLAELANAHGDFRNAAAMMEGCVVTFGMQNPDAAQASASSCAMPSTICRKLKLGVQRWSTASSILGTLAFRSRRPLISKRRRPPRCRRSIRTGSIAIPWELFSETVARKAVQADIPEVSAGIGRQADFADRLHVSAGRGSRADVVSVHRGAGRLLVLRDARDDRDRVTSSCPPARRRAISAAWSASSAGCSLNANDPEDFLYTVKDARVGASID